MKPRQSPQDGDAAHRPTARRDPLDLMVELPSRREPFAVATVIETARFRPRPRPRPEVRYLGLIASRKRAKLVLDYLREQGFSEADLARVRAPAGLNLGAETPEETALSVLSEIVLLRRGGSCRSMHESVGDNRVLAHS